jgi:transcriptional accessory protein Tex/SPT6
MVDLLELGIGDAEGHLKSLAQQTDSREVKDNAWTRSTRVDKELNVQPTQVAAAVDLLGEGATVPFIARYRKEKTGGLDDTQLRKLEERLGYLTELTSKVRKGKQTEGAKFSDYFDFRQLIREIPSHR